MKTSSGKKSFFNLFPTPEYLLLSNAGLSITDDGVRFVELERGLFGQELKLTRHEKIPLPEGVVQSGFINDEEKLTSILSGLSERHGLKYVYATLPEERAYLFTTYIDKVPKEGLRDAVAFIIEANAPVSLANSVFDFEVVEESKETGKIKVAVSVISKKVADFYMQVFSAAGITPVSFDIESQAIARAVLPAGDRGTHLIINLSDKKAGFYVVEDRVVQFTTTVSFGSSIHTNDSHTNDLKNEMSKVWSFWDTRESTTDRRKIGRIIFCGSHAGDKKLVTELTTDYSASVSVADVWGNVGVSVSDLPEDIYKDSLEYASAIGLALPHTDTHYV